MTQNKLDYVNESGDSLRVWMTELKEAMVTVKRGGEQVSFILPPKQTRQLRDLLITNCDNSGEPKQIGDLGYYWFCRECYTRFERKVDAQQCCGFVIQYYCKSCEQGFTLFEKPEDHFNKDGRCLKELEAKDDSSTEK